MNSPIKFICLSALLIGSASRSMDLSGDELCRAAMAGNLELIQEILATEVPVDSRDFCTWTPLLCAADRGHKKACKLLVKANAQVDATTINKITPLMRAAAMGHKEICRLLLDANANIDAKNDTGWTPKAYAVMNNQKDVCQLFLDEMIKPIKQKQTAAIILLGMKKFNKASCMKSNHKDVIRLIARQIFDPAEITKLFAEIETIENDEMREFIRTYAMQQLNITPKAIQGGSNE